MPTPPAWLALWTVQDETVTPPDSARLEGAVNVALQELCPDLRVGHSGLPTDPVVTEVVLTAIARHRCRAPTPDVLCQLLMSLVEKFAHAIARNTATYTACRARPRSMSRHGIGSRKRSIQASQ